MTILLTGSSGFIGTHLYRLLMGCWGHEKGDKLPDRKFDLVYHLAANSRAYQCVENPNLAIENIKITKEVLDWMVETGTKKIIFASSREVFDIQNPYGASKLACEALIEAYCRMYDIGAVSLRLPNIFGPGDHKDRFIPHSIETAEEKASAIYLYGGQKKLLNFVYINDCIDILLEAQNMIALGRHFWLEIAKPMSVSLYHVAQEIKVAMGKPETEIVDLPARKGEVDIYIPKNPLPWSFKWSLLRGIQKCL